MSFAEFYEKSKQQYLYAANLNMQRWPELRLSFPDFLRRIVPSGLTSATGWWMYLGEPHSQLPTPTPPPSLATLPQVASM